MGVISNLFLRAYKICDPEKLDSETDYIRAIFVKLGYNASFINKALNKAKKRFYGEANRNNFLDSFESLLIMPQTGAGDETLKKYLKNCGIVGVNKNTSTIKKYLSNIDPQPENRIKPCIYKITCSDCDKLYIGETIDIARRRREHRDAIRRGDENNAAFQHLQTEEHRVNISNMHEIRTVNETGKRKLLESILIQNCKNFNIHQCNYKLDRFVNNIIKTHVISVNKLIQHTNRPPEIE